MTGGRGGPVPRVLLVDDHVLLAESLVAALQAEGVAARRVVLRSRDALVAEVAGDPPDLVLLDLDLGRQIGDGAGLVRTFVEAGTRVLVLSASVDPVHLGTALEQGAVGLVSKSAPFQELIEAVVGAVRDEQVLAPERRHEVLHELRLRREQDAAAREPFERLTAREQQVLRALAEGRSVAAIAAEWFVAEATVRTQVRGVLMKLGVSSQLEAVAQAVRAGWLDG